MPEPLHQQANNGMPSNQDNLYAVTPRLAESERVEISEQQPWEPYRVARSCAVARFIEPARQTYSMQPTDAASRVLQNITQSEAAFHRLPTHHVPNPLLVPQDDVILVAGDVRSLDVLALRAYHELFLGLAVTLISLSNANTASQNCAVNIGASPQRVFSEPHPPLLAFDDRMDISLHIEPID